MLRILFVMAAVFSISIAQANELDNDSPITSEQVSLSKNLPATVVVRIADNGTKSEVLQSTEALPAGVPVATALNQLRGEFVSVQANSKVPLKELDRDSSTSSWYLYSYNPYYWSPCYYYYNYTYYYSSYWSFYSYGYWYYYYRWSW